MSRLAGGVLPHKQMPSRRSKNVVQVTANPAKSETKSEKKGEKRFASFCHNLPFSSGLRRLRQDLVNLVPRLEGRRSIRLSYGRTLQSSLPSIIYNYFFEHFIFNFRCNRCNNGFFGRVFGKFEAKSNLSLLKSSYSLKQLNL